MCLNCQRQKKKAKEKLKKMPKGTNMGMPMGHAYGKSGLYGGFMPRDQQHIHKDVFNHGKFKISVE